MMNVSQNLFQNILIQKVFYLYIQIKNLINARNLINIIKKVKKN